jgi:hypothetical protein
LACHTIGTLALLSLFSGGTSLMPRAAPPNSSCVAFEDPARSTHNTGCRSSLSKLERDDLTAYLSTPALPMTRPRHTSPGRASEGLQPATSKKPKSDKSLVERGRKLLYRIPRPAIAGYRTAAGRGLPVLTAHTSQSLPKFISVVLAN